MSLSRLKHNAPLEYCTTNQLEFLEEQGDEGHDAAPAQLAIPQFK